MHHDKQNLVATLEAELLAAHLKMTDQERAIKHLRRALVLLTAAITDWKVPVLAEERRAYSKLREAQFQALILAGVEGETPASKPHKQNTKIELTTDLLQFLKRQNSNRATETHLGTPLVTHREVIR